jgi:hypothetical protein
VGNQLSLGDFVRLLAALLHRRHVQIPFGKTEEWHLLFYELAGGNDGRKPQFFQSLFFDWDGPYPKSQELAQFLQALHWTASASANNPYFETIELPEPLARRWLDEFEAMAPDTKQYLEQATERAEARFRESAVA